jgi:two-component system, cell cycle sensor histidine kinase and response regulator CckA
MRRSAPKKETSEVLLALHAGKSVLVVDDEVAVRHFVKAVLVRAGLRVLEAEDGIEALRVLAAGKPDLLLTDIVMPRMGGIALMKAAVEKMPDLPVLLMSGFASEPGPSVRAIALIRKPFAPTALLEVVIRQLSAGC